MGAFEKKEGGHGHEEVVAAGGRKELDRGQESGDRDRADDRLRGLKRRGQAERDEQAFGRHQEEGERAFERLGSIAQTPPVRAPRPSPSPPPPTPQGPDAPP